MWHLISRKKIGLKLLHSTPLPPITIQRLLCFSRTFSTSLTHLRHRFSASSQGSRAQGTHGGGESAIKTGEETVDQLNFPSAWQSSCIEFLELPANGFAHQKKTQLRKKNRPPAADWNLEAPKCNKEMHVYDSKRNQIPVPR